MSEDITFEGGGGRHLAKARLTAVLVHGMGASPEWWAPIVAVLEHAGIAARPLTMPSLERAGPEAWCDEVLSQLGDEPVILMGHSLGAAVCMEAARCQPVGCLILLACPPFHPDFSPPPPPDTGLCLTATARVGRFLRRACANAAQVAADAVHFVGAADPWIPVAQARRLPFPLVVIPRANHGLNKSATFTTQLLRHVLSTRLAAEYLDPGVRLDYLGHFSRTSESGLAGELARLGLGEHAPAPARLDLEVTTRCQLKCQACARTMNADGTRDQAGSPRSRRREEAELSERIASSAPPHVGGYAVNGTDMPEPLFIKTLDQMPWVGEMFFVGLGEPLLHPRLPEFTRFAAQRGIRVRLVTNGLLAAPETLAQLRDAGLSEVTFSLDSTDEAVFRKLRGNAPLKMVLAHFRSVPASLRKSIFTTLSVANAGSLGGLVDLAADEGLPAIAVSDLNFAGNQFRSLARNDCAALLEAGLAHARKRNVLIIGPHFHETPELVRALRRSRVRTAADLTRRSAQHRHCLAPWRVAVISAEGKLSPCNCAPLTLAGSLQEQPFAELWNGEGMKTWRRGMLDGASVDCLGCPRY